MFKSKSELTEKYCKGKEHIGSHRMIGEIFKSFAERVEFYKRYWCSPQEFNDEFPDEFHKFASEEEVEVSEYLEEINEGLRSGLSFNQWLFDYCFGDVIE